MMQSRAPSSTPGQERSKAFVVEYDDDYDPRAAAIDAKLQATEKIIDKRIEFRKSTLPDSYEDLKAKFKPLNANQNFAKPQQQSSLKPEQSRPSSSNSSSKQSEVEAAIRPAYHLYPPERFQELIGWKKPGRIGAGLENLGNTCFMNSVLQCLTYTPPLTNYLLTGEHSKVCKKEGFCMLCELGEHTQRALKSHGRAIEPSRIARNLRAIGKMFRLGRQEDSHEFLRYVVEGMQTISLRGQDKKLDPKVQATTVIHQTFGGYLQSQVKCQVCGHESNTYDPFLDLSLEIGKANDVKRAFENFTQREVLDGNNKYKCGKCNKLVRAVKQMTVFRAPAILTIQLKRFDFTFNYGQKIGKFVEYPEHFDLQHFLSSTTRHLQSTGYKLYGVLVHFGGSTNSGHYFAYVRAANDIWYQMDDASVSQVSLKTVLSQKAYILFYERIPSKKESSATPSASAASSSSSVPVAAPAVVAVAEKKTEGAQKPVAAAPSASKKPEIVYAEDSDEDADEDSDEDYEEKSEEEDKSEEEEAEEDEAEDEEEEDDEDEQEFTDEDLINYMMQQNRRGRRRRPKVSEMPRMPIKKCTKSDGLIRLQSKLYDARIRARRLKKIAKARGLLKDGRTLVLDGPSAIEVNRTKVIPKGWTEQRVARSIGVLNAKSWLHPVSIQEMEACLADPELNSINIFGGAAALSSVPSSSSSASSAPASSSQQSYAPQKRKIEEASEPIPSSSGAEPSSETKSEKSKKSKKKQHQQADVPILSAASRDSDDAKAEEDHTAKRPKKTAPIPVLSPVASSSVSPVAAEQSKQKLSPMSSSSSSSSAPQKQVPAAPMVPEVANITPRTYAFNPLLGESVPAWEHVDNLTLAAHHQTAHFLSAKKPMSDQQRERMEHNALVDAPKARKVKAPKDLSSYNFGGQGGQGPKNNFSDVQQKRDAAVERKKAAGEVFF